MSAGEPPWPGGEAAGAAHFIERAMMALHLVAAAPDEESRLQMLDIVRSWLALALALATPAPGGTLEALGDGEGLSRH